MVATAAVGAEPTVPSRIDTSIYDSFAQAEGQPPVTLQPRAGVPDEDGNLVFRRVNGCVWLLPGYFASMMADAARTLDPALKEKERSAASRWLKFKHQFLDIKETGKPGVEIGSEKLIAPEGKGINYAESLPIGTEIPLEVKFPTTQLTAEQVMAVLEEAGEYVGFSIAKHHHGWGRFEVIPA